MRWFKHLSQASEDEKLSEILDLYGAEGYGIYWIILEKIAFLMDGSDKTFARYSVKKWSKFCGKSPKVFRKFLESFEKLLLFNVEICQNNPDFLIIDCPNLLKYRDEYTKKLGHTPDKLRKVSGHTPDQETELDTETELDKDKPKKKTFPEDSNEFQLSKYLFTYICKNNIEAKKPNFQTWSKDFDYLLRVDNRSIERVKQIIEWSQKDSFWMNNILSPKSLRKSFDRLISLSKQKPKNNEPLYNKLMGSKDDTITLNGDDYELRTKEDNREITVFDSGKL